MFLTGYFDQVPGLLKALQQNIESTANIDKLCSFAPDSITYIMLKSVQKEKKKHYDLLEKIYIEAFASSPSIDRGNEIIEGSFSEILKNMIFIETELINTYKNIYIEMKNSYRDKVQEIMIEEINNALKLNWIYSSLKK